MKNGLWTWTYTLRNAFVVSGQSSWLQNQRSWFDSRRYQIFWEVGLERGPLCLASTIEELLERKRSGSGLEKRDYGRRDPLRWPHDTIYPQKLALTSPPKGGRSVGIIRCGLRSRSYDYQLLKNHIDKHCKALGVRLMESFHGQIILQSNNMNPDLFMQVSAIMWALMHSQMVTQLSAHDHVQHYNHQTVTRRSTYSQYVPATPKQSSHVSDTATGFICSAGYTTGYIYSATI
jgi:hypothetical protein